MHHTYSYENYCSRKLNIMEKDITQKKNIQRTDAFQNIKQERTAM